MRSELKQQLEAQIAANAAVLRGLSPGQLTDVAEQTIGQALDGLPLPVMSQVLNVISTALQLTATGVNPWVVLEGLNRIQESMGFDDDTVAERDVRTTGKPEDN